MALPSLRRKGVLTANPTGTSLIFTSLQRALQDNRGGGKVTINWGRRHMKIPGAAQQEQLFQASPKYRRPKNGTGKPRAAHSTICSTTRSNTRPATTLGN